MFPACTRELGAALSDLNEESHFRRHFRVSGDNINTERARIEGQRARRFVLKNNAYYPNAGKTARSKPRLESKIACDVESTSTEVTNTSRLWSRRRKGGYRSAAYVENLPFLKNNI